MVLVMMLGISVGLIAQSFMSSRVSYSWVIMVLSMLMVSLGLELEYSSYILLSDWCGVDEFSNSMVVLVLLVGLMSLVSSSKEICASKNGSWGNSVGMVEGVIWVMVTSLAFFYSSGWMDFYFSFEAALIPTLYLILKWGYQPERLQAAMFMMMYTVSASLPLLMGLTNISGLVGSDNILLGSFLSADSVKFSVPVVIVMCLGFLIKVPVFMVHGWLPKAHVEAPLSGSMLLAGILLKFGAYGMVRLMWFIKLPFGNLMLALLVLVLWGGVFSSVLCVCQSDLKSFIAYSSIGHMALSLGGVLSCYSMGKAGLIVLLFAHGLCSPMLFSLAASVYEMTGSRNIVTSKGVLRIFPLFTMFWAFLCSLNMGLPFSMNFISEVACGISLVWLYVPFLLLICLSCFLAGCYCFTLYCLVNHGPLNVLTLSKGILSSRYLTCVMLSSFILFSGFCLLDLFIL